MLLSEQDPSSPILCVDIGLSYSTVKIELPRLLNSAPNRCFRDVFDISGLLNLSNGDVSLSLHHQHDVAVLHFRGFSGTTRSILALHVPKSLQTSDPLRHGRIGIANRLRYGPG